MSLNDAKQPLIDTLVTRFVNDSDRATGNPTLTHQDAITAFVDDVHDYTTAIIDSDSAAAAHVGILQSLSAGTVRSQIEELLNGINSIGGGGSPSTISLSWKASVVDKDLTAPPGAPGVGSRYIVGASATGTWSGQDGKVAIWDGSAWSFISGTAGDTLWVTDESLYYVYTTSWVPMDTRFDHVNLSNIGANTHVQIDSHISDATIHFTAASLNLGTTYLRLDAANDPITADLEIQGIASVEAVQFNTAALPAHSEGQIHWDDGDKTLELDTEVTDVHIQLGQEQVVRVTNKTGVLIPNGSVVYIDGAQGNRPTISLAKADAEATSSKTMGMTTHDIGINATGYVTTVGLVRGLQTQTFTEGSVLWLSDSVAGSYSETRPTSPNHATAIGICVTSNNGAGVILVRVQNGYELDELHDVLISSLTDNDFLQWNTAAGVWENNPLSEISHTAISDIGSNTHAQIDSHINDVAIHFQRIQSTAAVTTAIAVDTNVTGAGGVNLDAQLSDYDGLDFVTYVKVYLNGILLRNGADVSTTFDVYPGTNPVTGDLKFKKKLVAGARPDIVTMEIFSA